MKEVHEQIESVFSCATQSASSEGRGVVYVGRSQWMEIVRDAVTEHEGVFPCSFVRAAEAIARFEFGMGSSGFRQIMDEYRLDNQFVLVVEHHPEGLLSCYHIQI